MDESLAGLLRRRVGDERESYEDILRQNAAAVSAVCNDPEILPSIKMLAEPHTLTAVQFAESVADLFSAPARVYDLVARLWTPRLPAPRAVFLVKVCKDLDTKEKITELILDELIQGDDPYHMLGKSDMPGDAFSKLYQRLLEVANVTDIPEQKRAPFLQLVSLFEHAALDIILDQETFFTRTEMGNPGTLSEFVGKMVLVSMLFPESPFVKNGDYLDRVMAAVRYDDIINCRITGENPRDVEHQEVLLALSRRLQAHAPKVDGAYWKSIRQNPAFIGISYRLAHRDKDPDADTLLPLLLKDAYRKADNDLRKFEWMVSSIIYSHFLGQTAYEKFLADPANEYQATLGGNMSRTELQTPKCRIYLPGPSIALVTAYTKTADRGYVEYLHVADRIEQRQTLLDFKSRTASAATGELADHLIRCVDNFELFAVAYKSHIAHVKEKQATLN